MGLFDSATIFCCYIQTSGKLFDLYRTGGPEATWKIPSFTGHRSRTGDRWISRCLYICTCICSLKLHQADYQVEEGFFNSIWWGALSSNVFTICVVYWSLDCRGYFGVSNVVLVFVVLFFCCSTVYSKTSNFLTRPAVNIAVNKIDI